MLFLLGPVVAAVAALAKAQLSPDFGPIETRNHTALSLPFLRLDPRGAVLAPDAKQLSVGMTIANDYRNMTSGNLTLLEKYEYERLLFRYRIGLKNDSDLTFDLPIMDRSGGFLDPLIDIYHRMILGLTNNPRIGLPYGLSEVEVPGSHRFGRFDVGPANRGGDRRRRARGVGQDRAFQAQLGLQAGEEFMQLPGVLHLVISGRGVMMWAGWRGRFGSV